MATAAEKAGGVFSSGAVSESSVVSDAASSVAWKLSASFEVTEDYRELSLKKTKGKRLVDDDSLEDTASSPVSSPKVRIYMFSILSFVCCIELFLFYGFLATGY